MNGSAANDEERFDEIIADFLDAVAAGKAVNESQILADHPEFAEELKKFFADHQRVGGLLDAAPGEDATLPASSTSGRDADTPPRSGSATMTDLRMPEHYGVDPEKCVADYELLERIAEGGMGVVYKAKQLSLNRIVALKMIRTGEFADAEEIRRFRVEAEAAASLTHPGIVPIYQIGEDKGQHFFSMALVDGPSLADLIREQPMKPRRAAEYVVQVARAVQFAHEQGIIHRDIKPANVLVDKNDQPKVTDFGLAKQITSDHQLTMSGQILGTASYMSPEQAAGKQISPLADVYSLGALLYALLTKQPPFTGANPVDILLDVLSKDPASPSSLNVTLSRDLETICMRCLDKDPRRRYASAEALAEDLDRFLDGTPILARPIGRVEKWIRWCQRRPAIATAIFLSVMLCLASIAYFVKEGETRIFSTVMKGHDDGPDLAELARNHYQSGPGDEILAPTQRDELLKMAGHAMMLYQGDQSSMDANRAYHALADALEAELVVAPQDLALKSALADCLLQLARFRIPPHNPRDLAASLVAAADVDDVTHWLQRSAQLLRELRASDPDNSSLAGREAAIRVTMQKLPGTWQDRREHVAAAGRLSSDWDTAQGAIRFSWDTPVTDDAESETRQRSAKLGSAEQQLNLAHAHCERQEHLLAILAYQTAFASNEIPPPAYQRAFYDLAILAAHEPGKVEMAIANHWPIDARKYYFGMLGIRLADAR